MFVAPPHLYTEALTPSVAVFTREASREAKLNTVPKRGGPILEDGVKKRHQISPTSRSRHKEEVMGTQSKTVTIYKPKEVSE